jgi:hypothetical protein
MLEFYFVKFHLNEGVVMEADHWYELRVDGSDGTSRGRAEGTREGIAIAESGPAVLDRIGPGPKVRDRAGSDRLPRHDDASRALQLRSRAVRLPGRRVGNSAATWPEGAVAPGLIVACGFVPAEGRQRALGAPHRLIYHSTRAGACRRVSARPAPSPIPRTAVHDEPEATQLVAFSRARSGGNDHRAADRYPVRAVRIVVPYPPGGGSDLTGRTIGQKLAEFLGQTFVVDNRSGATGLIGTQIVAKAAPDGYTLLLADMPHAILPLVYAKAPYDAIRDFAPVNLLATSPQAFSAHPTFSANTLKELLAMPRAQTEKLGMGTTGLASGPHMTYELLRLKTGLTLNHVPYKGGGPALADAVAARYRSS